MVMGFGGAFISLFMSKMMAKWSTGAEIIDQPRNQTEAWLVDTAPAMLQRAGIAMPEVAIYEGEPNAFATGPSRNNSLVAVSTGFAQHESGRSRGGDRPRGGACGQWRYGDTGTLIQGVVNTLCSSRRGWWARWWTVPCDNESSGHGCIGYMVTVFVCEIAFGILASMIMAYSRQREYAADAGAAQLMGNVA